MISVFIHCRLALLPERSPERRDGQVEIEEGGVWRWRREECGDRGGSSAEMEEEGMTMEEGEL